MGSSCVFSMCAFLSSYVFSRCSSCVFSMCAYLCIFNEQFLCIFNVCVFSMSQSCVFSMCAFLCIFSEQFLCIFNEHFLCIFNDQFLCVQIFVCTFIGNSTLPKQPFHRQRRLSVYLSLSFQRQTRNTSGPTGVLRSKLILFLLIFLSDQKYVWVLWSSKANRQGID